MICAPPRKYLAGAIGMAMAILLFTSCDETRSFTFINSTSQPVEVAWSLESEEVSGSIASDTIHLAPGESKKSFTYIFYGSRSLRVQVTSGTDTIVDRVYSYGELKEMNFRIEIGAQEPP